MPTKSLMGWAFVAAGAVTGYLGQSVLPVLALGIVWQVLYGAEKR